MIRLLLPVDGSENAARAVQAVADWHRRLAPIEVHLLFVRVSDSVPPASLGQLERDDAVGRGQRALESAEALLARVGVPCTREMRDGYVPSVIVQCANSILHRHGHAWHGIRRSDVRFDRAASGQPRRHSGDLGEVVAVRRGSRPIPEEK